MKYVNLLCLSLLVGCVNPETTTNTAQNENQVVVNETNTITSESEPKEENKEVYYDMDGNLYNGWIRVESSTINNTSDKQRNNVSKGTETILLYLKNGEIKSVLEQESKSIDSIENNDTDFQYSFKSSSFASFNGTTTDDKNIVEDIKVCNKNLHSIKNQNGLNRYFMIKVDDNTLTENTSPIITLNTKDNSVVIADKYKEQLQNATIKVYDCFDELQETFELKDGQITK